VAGSGRAKGDAWPNEDWSWLSRNRLDNRSNDRPVALEAQDDLSAPFAQGAKVKSWLWEPPP